MTFLARSGRRPRPSAVWRAGAAKRRPTPAAYCRATRRPRPDRPFGALGAIRGASGPARSCGHPAMRSLRRNPDARDRLTPQELAPAPDPPEDRRDLPLRARLGRPPVVLMTEVASSDARSNALALQTVIRVDALRSFGAGGRSRSGPPGAPTGRRGSGSRTCTVCCSRSCI
jgi:hypothetical protein